MTLHLFVNTATETLVHAFHGDTKEAQRFLSHAINQGQPVRHIVVHSGEIRVANEVMAVVK